MAEFLKEGNKQEKGWIRKEECLQENFQIKQKFSVKEKIILALQCRLLSHLPQKEFSPRRHLLHAWDITNMNLKNHMMRNLLKKSGTTERKN